ncbi:MAG: hypothetical protein RL166_880 [Actinomycetota bacterium]
MNLLKPFGLFLFLLFFAGCTTATPTPSAKASWIEGACSLETPGVSLSIDYLGEVTTHCALGFDGNGWGLFKAAGFDVKGTAKYPTAFACQIDGEPANAKCDDSETSGAYWGYYLAKDGTWGYATTGAADHKSVCGTHEGWVYMETDKTPLYLPKPSEFACN